MNYELRDNTSYIDDLNQLSNYYKLPGYSNFNNSSSFYNGNQMQNNLGNNPFYPNNPYNNFYNAPYNNPYINQNMQQGTYQNVSNAEQRFNNGFNELDFNLYYPVVYRIIYPVVKKAIYSSNTYELDENILNNLTDTVFNIVDGDVIKEDREEGKERDINNYPNSSINNQGNVQNNTSQRNNNTNKDFVYNDKLNQDKCNRLRDDLVKDIIRILIINEYKLIHNSMNHNNFRNRY